MIKMFRIVFWDVLPCKMIVDDGHTRRRENLKSHILWLKLRLHDASYSRESSPGDVRANVLCKSCKVRQVELWSELWLTLLLFIALMMVAVRTSETSVHFNVTTTRYIPEDSKLHTRRCQNLTSYIIILTWKSACTSPALDSREPTCTM
jgi:hypothetical protein